jgi:hypothetical protein
MEVLEFLNTRYPELEFYPDDEKVFISNYKGKTIQVSLFRNKAKISLYDLNSYFELLSLQDEYFLEKTINRLLQRIENAN